MKKPGGAGPSGAGPLQLGDYLPLYPTLTDYLTCEAWEDGTPRVPATVMLFAQDGRWKVCINDKAMSRVAFIAGLTPESALQAAEDGLASDDLDWRTVDGGGRRKFR